MAKQHSEKKICITGGHLSPAVAVIEEIGEQKKPWDIVFVGRAKTSQGNTRSSEEKVLMEKLAIPFFPIHAGRVARFISLGSLVEFLLIPLGFVQAFLFCLRERPDCIVSFGGYVGLPVVVAGWLLGIPTVIHEQTHQFGLANTIASEIADKVLLTFPDANKKRDARVTVTGLPLRLSFRRPSGHVSFSIPDKKPLLYITGGTTGAVSMNKLLFPAIQTLVRTYTIIHQTGEQSYPEAKALQDTLPAEDASSYIPKTYIGSDDVSWIMHHAALIIGRSGANTVAETAAVQKPAVFIPLPWGGHREQLRNATWYAATGANVTIVDQKKMSPEELKKIILDMAAQQQNNSKAVSEEINSGATGVVQAIAALA